MVSNITKLDIINITSATLVTYNKQLLGKYKLNIGFAIYKMKLHFTK